jgi:hypothetical protein
MYMTRVNDEWTLTAPIIGILRPSLHSSPALEQHRGIAPVDDGGLPWRV